MVSCKLERTQHTTHNTQHTTHNPLLLMKTIVYFILTMALMLPAPIAAAQTVIEAETMTISGNYRAVDGGFVLLGPGVMSHTTNFENSGDITLIIRAKGEYAGGAWPICEVRLGSTVIASIDIDSAEWKDFEVTTSITAGARGIGYAFINDFYDAPDDRNFYLDKVTIIENINVLTNDHIAWKASADPEVTYYKIYYGARSRFRSGLRCRCHLRRQISTLRPGRRYRQIPRV